MPASDMSATLIGMQPDVLIIFQKLGIALGLGLLVGLQREYSVARLAGIRTFPVITVFGLICALLGRELGGWIVGFGLVALAALVVIGNLPDRHKTSDSHPGLTTEAAMLLMYGVGAFLAFGAASVAVAIGAGLAVLLAAKEPLHGIVKKMGPDDIRAIMQFALITLVILPVLPDHGYGPYEAFNPYRIWLMVALIVGISLAGYVAYKLFDRHTGTLLAGVLGGLISSTATTVSYARRVIASPQSAALAAAIIMIASTIVFARVIVEVAVVAPLSLRHMAPPLAVMGAWMALLSLVAYFWAWRERAEMPAQGNPAELKPALIFAGLYAAVTLATLAANDYLGTSGLYVVAVITGLHDMDAITLSTARLVNQEHVTSGTGWRVIMTAGLSNLVFKAAIAGALGPRRLLLYLSLLYAGAIVGGIALIFLWPA